MIPYGRQDISQQDIDAVISVLKSDFLTQGPKVGEFESALKLKAGASFAIAVNSATSALHIACLSLGVKSGDIVWTSPITFVASSNAVLYCGATVDFVDIDPLTYNFAYSAFEEKLNAALRSGKLPKAIIPVHLAGQSPEMDNISELCKKHNIRIIEDASHAIGASYKGMPVGNCKFSDITVFSFHPVKIITTGEGGALTTNDPEIAKKLFSLRSHGITRVHSDFIRKNEGDWYYEQQDLGFNYRITDFQAALGISQLQKLETSISKRHEIASIYNNALRDIVITPYQDKNSYSAYHLYVVRQKGKRGSQKEFFQSLRHAGIGVNLHYIPVYKQPYYMKLGFSENYCSHAEEYYRTAITLPLHPLLKDEEIEYVIKKVQEFAD